MIFREAFSQDIAQMHFVRMAVKENALSNPAFITEADYEEYITQKGKGWVCEMEGKIVGFAIADLKENNIWALFIHPDFEGRGIGKRLHDLMLNWYFGLTSKTVWLSTSPGTRAESFYRKAGWKEVGIYGKGEVKFEMDIENWGG